MDDNKMLLAFNEAFLKAQKELKDAPKDKANPFFHSHYASLTSVWEAAKEALHKNGIFVIQSTGFTGDKFILRTMLLHKDGFGMSSEYWINPEKANNPQALASAVTYARRYGLAAMVGIMVEDDDGNKASETEQPKQTMHVQHSNQPKTSGDTQKTTFVPQSVKEVNGTSKAGKPFTAYNITNEDGYVFSTLDENMAQTAMNAEENKTPVKVSYVKNGKFLNIVSLESTVLEDVSF